MVLFTVAFLIAGCVTAAFGLYLLVLSVACFFYSQAGEQIPTRSRLAVLIPAHDEAGLIAQCVGSLRAQTYPKQLYEIVVVADNCTDATAAIARAAGAGVMVRHEPDARGKGRALRWAMERILATDLRPAAIVVVDADAVTDEDFLVRLAQPFDAGAAAVQGDYLLVGDGSPRTALRAAAFLLVNRVRPAGRAALGLSAPLVGNGMLLATDLLLARPWGAFTSTEDLEYALDLQAAGVQIAYAGEAHLRSSTAPNADAAAVQQLRWEGGRTYLLRTRLPRLLLDSLRTLSPAPAMVAFDLAVPPLGLLAAGAIAGSLVAAGLTIDGVWSPWALLPWLVAGAATALHVLIGLRAGHAPKSAYRALLRAPLFILAKPLRVGRVLRFRPDTWIRTERAGDGTEKQP